MRRVKIYLLFVVIISLISLDCKSALGFTIVDLNGNERDTNEYHGTFIHWNLDKELEGRVRDGKVLYKINSAGSDDIDDFSAIEAAIKEAADAWQTVETTSFRIEYDGQTNNKKDPDDGINTIFWDEKGKWVPLDAYAKTFITSDPQTGEIIDVDIGFNGDKGFAPLIWNKKHPWYWKMFWTLEDIQQDDWFRRRRIANVQANATHEFGHLLGLGHSSVSGATMSTGGTGTYQRYLEEDDMEGVSFLYPNCDDDISPPTILNTNFINGGAETTTSSTSVNIRVTVKDDCGINGYGMCTYVQENCDYPGCPLTSSEIGCALKQQPPWDIKSITPIVKEFTLDIDVPTYVSGWGNPYYGDAIIVELMFVDTQGNVFSVIDSIYYGSSPRINPIITISPLPYFGPLLLQAYGFTPTNHATWYYQKIDGTDNQNSIVQVDLTGRFSYAFQNLSSGTYIFWAIDNSTGLKSNEVSYEITTGDGGGYGEVAP